MWRGEPRGDTGARGAEATGVLLLAKCAPGGGGPGWRAGRGAARLFGVSSRSSLHRRQPPSPAKQPSGPGGCREGLSQHLPAVSHSLLRDTEGFALTRARLPLHAPFGAKNQNSKPKDAGMREQG